MQLAWRGGMRHLRVWIEAIFASRLSAFENDKQLLQALLSTCPKTRLALKLIFMQSKYRNL